MPAKDKLAFDLSFQSSDGMVFEEIISAYLAKEEKRNWFNRDLALYNHLRQWKKLIDSYGGPLPGISTDRNGAKMLADIFAI